MAEIIFDCPACKKPVQADDAWAGQQIECPLCKAPMIVPPAPAAGAHAGGGGRTPGRQQVQLSGGMKFSTGSPQAPRASDGRGLPQTGFQHKQVKKTNPMVRYAIIGVVIVALAGAGWYAWPQLQPYIPFLKKTAEESATASADAAKQAAGANTPEAAPPPPPPEVPMTAPAYTLDILQARISAGKVNGSIAGTKFVPDSVRLDKQAGGYLLTLRQGTGQTPDRGLQVQLQMAPTESPTGQTWTVSQEMKGTAINRVIKVWKPNPKFAAQTKPFTTGFALKLEFGPLTESNTIPGKIYAALPDSEQTVVAGVFNATTTLAGGQPEPGVAPPAIQDSQSAAQKAEFEKRYGIKR